MTLYLSSKRIPNTDELADLLGKPLRGTSVALIANSKDCFVKRARDCLVEDFSLYLAELGLDVEVVDLRDYYDTENLKSKLANYDLIWAMGGNTLSSDTR